MRRFLIQGVLPLLFMCIPVLAAGLVFLAIPTDATTFFIDQLMGNRVGSHVAYMDWLILSLGSALFVLQMMLCWRAFRWRRTGFDSGADRWINHLSQAAEWFPMLGGHEGSGVVEEVGPEVNTLKPGDHVAISFFPACGNCRWCSTGHTYLCNVGADIRPVSQFLATVLRSVNYLVEKTRPCFGANGMNCRALGAAIARRP